MAIEKWLRKNITIPLFQIHKGASYQKELTFVKSFHQKSEYEIKAYQLAKLKKLIDHAYANVPYYYDEWREIGLEPGDIKSFSDFENIPLLTKTKIRNNAERLFSKECRKEQLIKSGTGGTTDSPITIYYSKKRARIKDAEMHYFREWYNWFIGDKVAFLWGAPQDIPNISNLKFKLVNRITDNKLYLFSSFLNNDTMDEFVKKLNIFKPDILQGYSNPVHIMADYILKHSVNIHPPKSIVLTAEPCQPSQRKTIEKAFNAEVFTFYGCREGGYVGSECNQHTGYHINSSSIYMEFVNDRGKASPGELSNIIFTDLFNYDMPFIRYQIGDLGIPSQEKCACGSPLPLMKFFAGRETDVFVTPSGSYVPGVSLCDRIIEDCKGIQQLQFIQNTIDELSVKIVKGPDYSERDMKQLDERLNYYFKGELNIIKIYVDNIPKERSGKTRFCISNVSKSI
jgi:phenylacetate-CoA ligase